jgi:predicted transglutaminase-like cysteine proteinase
MSTFVNLVRLCLLLTAVCSANTFADVHPGGLIVAVNRTGDGIAVAQAMFGNDPDSRPLATLPAFSAEAPAEKQAAVEPQSIWQRAIAAKLVETSANWTELQARIRTENATLTACRSGSGFCPPVARRFLSIVEHARQREGRARFGEINRAINLSVRPTTDTTMYGVADFRSTPLAILSHGTGDCTDYAVTKYVALQEMGVAADDLKLEVVRDLERQVTHALVVVHDEGKWWILDNRTMTMVAAQDARRYEPLFALDSLGVRAIPTDAGIRRLAEHSFDISSNIAAVDHAQKIN